jgi:hypothetical protein
VWERATRKPEPEGLDDLTGEDRNKVYRMLRLEVTPSDEGYKVGGAFCTLEPMRSLKSGNNKITTLPETAEGLPYLRGELHTRNSVA